MNRKKRVWLLPSAGCVCLLLLAVLVSGAISGCGGPSQITVTAMRQIRDEDTPGDDQDDLPDTDPVIPDQQGESLNEDVSASNLAVYVCGAVQEPGVYYFPEGARICDAIEAAGGFSRDADSQWLNQAKILSDGDMLVVCTKEETAALRGEGAGTASGTAAPADPGGMTPAGVILPDPAGTGNGSKVNLNTASKEELMTLPGIGEAKAEAIIRYRTEVGFFASAEDVMNISGIKSSVYAKICDRVTV